MILIKNAKNNFLLLKKVKNTESAQLCWYDYTPLRSSSK